MDPTEALDRIAFLLERSLAPLYKSKAFRGASRVLAAKSVKQIIDLNKGGRLQSLPGVGKTTAAVIEEALRGDVPSYLVELEAEPEPAFEHGAALHAALKGDCHTHSDWSDGNNPIIEMARTEIALGRDYMVLTDHSPRLTVANGLTAERLMKQLQLVKELNEQLAPFRILTGIEVDILDDGGLDQEPELLAQLDVVVASVHSKLKMDAPAMTKRMLAAVANPNTDILGHCTGRLMLNKQRPQSQFDAKAVFDACLEHNTAVEINSRPERKDPPMELLRLAADMGCTFSIDSDAHAPGQLDWLPIGCDRAEQAGIDASRVINTKSAGDLISWTNA